MLLNLPSGPTWKQIDPQMGELWKNRPLKKMEVCTEKAAWTIQTHWVSGCFKIFIISPIWFIPMLLFQCVYTLVHVRPHDFYRGSGVVFELRKLFICKDLSIMSHLTLRSWCLHLLTCNLRHRRVSLCFRGWRNPLQHWKNWFNTKVGYYGRPPYVECGRSWRKFRKSKNEKSTRAAWKLASHLSIFPSSIIRHLPNNVRLNVR